MYGTLDAFTAQIVYRGHSASSVNFCRLRQIVFAFNTLDIISVRVVYSVYKFPLHLLALDVKWLIPRS